VGRPRGEPLDQVASRLERFEQTAVLGIGLEMLLDLDPAFGIKLAVDEGAKLGFNNFLVLGHGTCRCFLYSGNFSCTRGSSCVKRGT